MDKELQDAIIQTESSGRPHVEGDDGQSHGLMQIQENTAKGLHRQGLLPEKWQGKKVKRKDLPLLLKDPEFNKMAGTALYVDNKNRLKKVAEKHGIQYTPDQLNDWAIKAHNQGVTRTIKREVLGQEPILPNVDNYLNKVKSQISVPSPELQLKPAYQEGGLVEQNPLEAQIAQEIAQSPEQADNILKNLEMARLSQENPNIPPEVSEKIVGYYNEFMKRYQEAQDPEQKQKVLEGLVASLDEFAQSHGTGQPIIPGQPQPIQEAPQEFADGGIPQAIAAPSYDPALSQFDEDPVKAEQELFNKLTNVDQYINPPLPEPIENLASQEPENKEGITSTEEKIANELGKTKTDQNLLKQNLSVARKPETSLDIPDEEKDSVRNDYDRLIEQYNLADKEKNKAKKLKALLDISQAAGKFATQYGRGKAMVAGGFDVKAPELNMKEHSIEDLYKGPDLKILEAKRKLMKELKDKKLSEKDKFYMKLQSEQLDIQRQRLKQQDEISRLNRLARTDKEAQRKLEALEKRQLKADDKIYKVTKDFEGNKLKKALDDQGMSFDQANSLMQQVEGGNEIALGSLGTKMARAMGEVGVLTDADVKRYIEAQSYVRKGRDWFARRAQGKLYDKTVKDLKGLIGKMQSGFRVKEKDVYNRYIKRAYHNYGKQSGIGLDEIHTRFGMSYKNQAPAEQKAQVNEVKRRDPKTNKIAVFDKDTKQFLRWEE